MSRADIIAPPFSLRALYIKGSNPEEYPWAASRNEQKNDTAPKSWFGFVIMPFKTRVCQYFMYNIFMS